jgi:S-adenosylmethionine:tRNA ribosyltransferase-isomerase
MTAPRLRVDDVDYQLPADAIAQTPAEPRDASRLLVLDRATGTLQHATFRDVGRWLRAGDLLVVNDSRVIPARLAATRVSGGSAELLVLRQLDDAWHWEALVRPSRRLAVGDTVTLRNGAVVEVGERLGDGTRVVAFPDDRDPHQLMAEAGEMPLPPYIRDRSAPPDRYQTVYARPPGSAAAPTAGLHFTPDLLERLAARGVALHKVTLHVGPGTFLPVKTDDTSGHKMHSEFAILTAEVADALNAARAKGGRIVAVGSTALRTLESAAAEDGMLEPFAGETSIFITPGYRFKAVDLMLTNFHLPRSTLFMLVSAFSGLDTMQRAYRHAIDSGYRFYSYGDACLLYPQLRAPDAARHAPKAT